MSEREHPRTAREKALALNLDTGRYGTFAEIGAGQEVVRWFFRVGAAAGTVSKSMSAYDMKVSDAIYGPAKRYVTRERLQAMLDYEHDLNLTRLGHRAHETAFFAFADTVVARSYKGGNECHAWMGVKFQAQPGHPDSQIVVHVRMLDDENQQQSESLGLVGVNLVYGAAYLHQDPHRLLESLLDDLGKGRIEIDMVDFEGDAFQDVDNRVMSLDLVHLGLTDAALFSADGEVLQVSEVLYKKPVLVERGSFRPVTRVGADILRCASRRFRGEPDMQGREELVLAEITMSNLLTDGAIDFRDFIDRVDLLATGGITVLISNYPEYYRLAAYLARNTSEPIGLALGAHSLLRIFDEKFYTHLDGGILEGFGRLFKGNLKLYVYPMLDPESGRVMTIENLRIEESLLPIYRYLVSQGFIEQLEGYDESLLHIYSRDVLAKIHAGEHGWEGDVPEGVAKLVKSRKLFGWPHDG